MRFTSLIAAIVMTVTLLAACPTAHAKHTYFANIHPWANYLNRCLGFGWSDGYHAKNGWNVEHSTYQVGRPQPAPGPAVYRPNWALNGAVHQPAHYPINQNATIQSSQSRQFLTPQPVAAPNNGQRYTASRLPRTRN